MIQNANRARTAGGEVLEVKGRPNQAGTIMHDTQAHAFFVAGIGGQTGAVIGHGEEEATAGGGERDDQVTCLAMTNGVARRFLGDSIQLESRPGVGPPDDTGTFKATGDMEGLGQLVGQILERDGQAI